MENLIPHPSFQKSAEVDLNKLWIPKIISKLIEKERIYQLIQSNGYGYFLQA